jgi:hypothetical protein
VATSCPLSNPNRPDHLGPMGDRQCPYRCRYHVDRVPLHTSFKSRKGAGHAPTRRHVPCSTGPYLPANVGSETVMCPVVSDPASMMKRAPALPRILQIQILPPYRGGLQSTVYPTTPDPASLPGGLRCHHRMLCGFLWIVGLKHKEKASRLAYAGRHACSQRTHACFQSA